MKNRASLLAGFASADITPAGAVDICGFAARKQPSTGVGAPLSVRVVALRSGRLRAVVAVCDLLGFTVADSRRLEARIAASGRMPAGNVFLCCTHTHSGAMSMPLGAVGRFERSYVEFVGKRLEYATSAAVADLAPVTATRTGDTGISDLGEYRCGTDEPGRDAWPGRLAVLHLERGARPPLVLAHVGIHPYVLGPQSRVIHPDYPGATCRHLEKMLGGRAVVLPGCGGDVSPVPGMTRSLKAVDRFGLAVATAAREALETAEPIDAAPLKTGLLRPRLRFGFLPAGTNAGENSGAAMKALAKAGDTYVTNYRIWEQRLRTGQLPRSTALPIHVLRLGSITLVGIAAEIFFGTQHDLQRTFPGGRILVVSQAGGNVGYLPRPFAYRRPTYETASAFQWYLTAGAVAPGEEARIRNLAAHKLQDLGID